MVGYRADSVPGRPSAIELRGNEPRAEGIGATRVSAVRDGQPIVASDAHEAQPTGAGVAIARSGEIYGGIRTADFVVEVPTIVPGTADIELGLRTGTVTSGREDGEGVGGGHVETGRTRVVDGLDNGVVVEASCGVAHRPEVIISGVTPVISVKCSNQGKL